MKPLEFEKITALFLEGRLLMLNAGVLGLRYVVRLLRRGATSVTSKGGIALPPELWEMILPMARGGNYVLVQAELVSETDGRKVLECREARLEHWAGGAGQLFDSLRVGCYEAVLNNRRTTLWDGDEPPEIVIRESTYQVVVEAEEKYRCLFEDLSVPDVIARVEKGKCRLCSGERFVCPEHDEVREFFGDVMRLSRCVNFACPLCLANISSEHDDFLESYEDELPSKRERKQMALSIKRALRELGYPPVLKH